MPDMIPENEAYDMARNIGVFEDDMYGEIEAKDDEGRDVLLSMSGVRSLALSGSTSGRAAVVSMVGSALG